MKTIFKYILAMYLKALVKIIIFINSPFIIAIAGSTNKTFTKEAIIKILEKSNISFLSNPKSFNTEIGLPLAILSLPSGYNYFYKWLPALHQSIFSIFKRLPKYLVLELGVSNKGDMKHLLSMIKPDIAIITDITQRYIESFSGMDELIEEYEYLAKKTKKEGMILLNNDNNRIKLLAKSALAKIITFGFSNESKCRCQNLNKNIAGQNFAVSYNDKITEHKIPYFGRHHVYSFLSSYIIKDYVNQAKKIQ